MVGEVLLTVSRSDRIRQLITALPVSGGIVRRFIAGERDEDAIAVTRALAARGLRASLDHLGEDITAPEQATATTEAYVVLLRRLSEEGLAGSAEVSVKLSAVGQALDEAMAVDNAHRICEAAAAAGTTVTLDMEDHTTTDSTLRVLRALRADYPGTGAVLQAYLRRTEADCRDLAGEGSRVRLCKGAYREPESVAYQSAHDVDLAYVRCLKVLMAGAGYPMVASHDPRLVEIAQALATRHGRKPDTYEFQMLYGVRPEGQRRLAAAGETVRVYVPYGVEWYGYMMRRLAERPANVAFFLRSLATRG